MTSSHRTYSAESDEIGDFVKSMTQRSGLTEGETYDALIASYGTLENSMKEIRKQDAEAMDLQSEALREMYPDGGGPINIGVKPTSRESVNTTQINDRVWLRVWGDNMANLHTYCFDFVDNGQYMSTPEGVEIYAQPSGARVWSIEASVGRAMSKSRQVAGSVHATDAGRQLDEKWETYVISEGTDLRIMQPGCQDIYIQIPTHMGNASRITFQPAHYR